MSFAYRRTRVGPDLLGAAHADVVRCIDESREDDGYAAVLTVRA
jgi:hypothetical protein